MGLHKRHPLWSAPPPPPPTGTQAPCRCMLRDGSWGAHSAVHLWPMDLECLIGVSPATPCSLAWQMRTCSGGQEGGSGVLQNGSTGFGIWNCRASKRPEMAPRATGAFSDLRCSILYKSGVCQLLFLASKYANRRTPTYQEGVPVK